jgi:hypothetical protein
MAAQAPIARQLRAGAAAGLPTNMHSLLPRAGAAGLHNIHTSAARASRIEDNPDLPPMHPGMKRTMEGLHNVMHEPIYNKEELVNLTPKHRKVKGIRDSIAFTLCQLMRTGFDVVTGYDKSKVRHQLPPWAIDRNDNNTSSYAQPIRPCLGGVNRPVNSFH